MLFFSSLGRVVGGSECVSRLSVFFFCEGADSEGCDDGAEDDLWNGL